MTSGFHSRFIGAAALCASAVALAGCTPAAGHATGPQSPQQETSAPQSPQQETSAPQSSQQETSAPQSSQQETSAPQSPQQETSAPQSSQQETSAPAASEISGLPAPERVVIIGDSLSTGDGTSPEEAWPLLLGRDLRSEQQPVEIINAAQNGSGYIAVGDGGATFGSQISAAVDASTDVVVFFGSDNDAGQDPAELKAAVADALGTSKELAPHAALVVIGPLTAFDPVQPDIEVILDQERTAALDVGATFIDPVAEQWIPGPDSPLLGPDGEHPSSQGQQFLEEKVKGILPVVNGSSALPSPPNAPPN